MRLIALLLVTVLALPTGVFAQDTQRASQHRLNEMAAHSVDASKLGVDLSRIRRELAEPESVDADSPLKLSFTVQVIGVAPKIDLLQGFSLDGAIPYGAPTHREFLDVVTPQAYRSPVFPISALAAVAAQKLWQYSKKQQCEAEIEEYRKLVMQGVAVSAPRCAR